MRRPIKHVLDDLVTSEAGGALRTIVLARGVTAADPYGAAQSQVNAGSAVITTMHVMLEFLINNQAVASGVVYDALDWYIWFNVAGAQTRPTANAVGQSDLKNQVFRQGHSLMGASTVTTSQFARYSRVVYEFDIKIPTWAQKINKDDQIELNYLFSDAAATHFTKMKVIFKEIEQS